jgi:hypothetical protein
MSGRPQGAAVAPPDAAGDGEPRLTLAERLAWSPAEAAQALGISENHLRTLLPELPHVYLGRRVVIPVEPLREWLSERARSEAGRVDATVKEILDGIK